MEPITDSIGATVKVGDTVMINAWGSPVRLIDIGKRAKVLGFTRTGNLLLDDSGYSEGIANGRSVRPGYVGVLRRDGEPGFEGNRPRCTCGARDFASCLCGLSPRDFHATA